ncbi:replicative DNA helicase [Nesterenkonia alkaliphila]|uniref:Replicative DNA helicase n=1 Tax=Nesterenkonia alkaliphila TaxID=1463631 RepID=A0A7K1UFY9_9MICC|nr:replicative DNA helicase [Nesterenkonia alkaliphila]MVT25378.1 replicative DNA helicase [Nesterenkonia alkaliphila]GFZ83493.1 replicative DNA helicase [Nesterenkonia alkaliphila]
MSVETYDPGTGAGAESRTPPQDMVAEQSVLGGMLLNKDAIADVVEVLRGRDFYRPAHELIFEAIIDLYSRGEPADEVTVSDELSKKQQLQRVGGPAYLHNLAQSVPTAANAGFYADIVRERAILRRLVEAGTKIVQLGHTADGEVDEIVNEAQAEIYTVAENRQSADYSRLSEILAPTIEEIEVNAANDGTLTGIPTGFRDLDDLTHGFHGGQLIVIAARPAMGKSVLALDFARSASVKHGMTTAFFSLEMGKVELTMRLLAAESAVHFSDLRKGSSLQDEHWEKMARAMDHLEQAPLYIDDAPNLSLMEIRAKCRRLKQRENLKLIIVDYLQLLMSGKRVESRQQEVSEFSRTLKLLAKELDVPIIALSQLNRGSEQRPDKRPQVSDLRESGAIEQDADMVMLLHRPEVYDKETERAGEADIIVAKNRNGPTRDITLIFQGHFQRFAEMARDF